MLFLTPFLIGRVPLKFTEKSVGTNLFEPQTTGGPGSILGGSLGFFRFLVGSVGASIQPTKSETLSRGSRTSQHFEGAGWN